MKWRALEISSGTVNEFGERAYGFGDRIYEFGERAYRFEDRAHGLEDRTVGVLAAAQTVQFCKPHRESVYRGSWYAADQRAGSNDSWFPSPCIAHEFLRVGLSRPPSGEPGAHRPVGGSDTPATQLGSREPSAPLLHMLGRPS